MCVGTQCEYLFDSPADFDPLFWPFTGYNRIDSPARQVRISPVIVLIVPFYWIWIHLPIKHKKPWKIKAFLLFLGSMNALYAIAWALWGNSRHSVGYFNGKSWCFPLVYSFSAGSSNGVIVMSTLPIRTVPSRRAPMKTASVFFVFMVFLLFKYVFENKNVRNTIPDVWVERVVIPPPAIALE